MCFHKSIFHFLPLINRVHFRERYFTLSSAPAERWKNNV